jgi:hypothetical protein
MKNKKIIALFVALFAVAFLASCGAGAAGDLGSSLLPRGVFETLTSKIDTTTMQYYIDKNNPNDKKDVVLNPNTSPQTYTIDDQNDIVIKVISGRLIKIEGSSNQDVVKNDYYSKE